MFVSGLFCKPILCFVLSCGIRVASKSSVDSIPYSKWCSHIFRWILILLDHQGCLFNPFQPVCFSSSKFDHSNIRKINSKLFLNGVYSICPSCLCFPALPPFSSRTQISQSCILLLMGSLSILFRQCSYPVILRKILTELQVHHSLFFSGGFNSSFLDHIFSLFQMLSHAGVPLNHPLLAIHVFKIFRDYYLIQVI